MLQKNVIAVVDDDAGIRGALEGLLTSWGYGVELYGSAEEFIRAAISSAAACLLVDIQLGDVSGVELGRHLAIERPYVPDHLHDWLAGRACPETSP